MKRSKEMTIYYIILALVAMGLGFSDRIFSNYFREVYNADGFIRGFIEFPRELPGVLCIFIITLLSFKSDIKIAIIAQVLSAIGLLVLGFITPPFAIMLVFLFINSVGMHLFFPLTDSIGLELSKKSEAGKSLGNFKGISIAFSMVASLIVYIGFKFGFFSFASKIKVVLLLGAVFAILALFLLMVLDKITKIDHEKPTKLFFKKKYLNYYLLAILQGAQKQIMFVFGPWVLIELLGKGADYIAILVLIGSFIGMFFTPLIGRWIDKFGIKKILYLDAYSYIFVYLGYGIATWAIVSNNLKIAGISVIIASLFYIFDNMSMQVGMVKVVYLNHIIENRADLTPTLSLGISMDHVLSILAGVLGGVIWSNFGPQYVFFIAAFLSLFNIIIAKRVKIIEQE